MKVAEPWSLAQLRERLDVRLRQLYSDKVLAAGRIDPLYAELLQHMGEFIARGGKRLRPYLTYLGYVGCGGQSEGDIIDVAASQELIHNFLLIHDDIIDRDLKRYGGLNISGVYAAKLATRLRPAAAGQTADAMALLAGDINFGLGFELILESDFAPELRLKAANRLHRMIFEIAGGEQLDIWLPLLDETAITPERLLQISRYKTASYTFETTLQIGAIVAGADNDSIAAISRYAIPLGIAFQVRDDVLGLFGNENKLGKPTLSDLREGKQTLLMHYGLQLAASAQRDTLRRCLGKRDVSYSDLGKVRLTLKDCGALSKVEELAKQKANEAAAALTQLPFTEPVKAELLKLCDVAIRREA